MPSIVPLLSYSASSPDNDASVSACPTSQGSSECSPKSSKKNLERKEGEVGSRNHGATKLAKKSGKKKRRPSGRVSPGIEAPASNETSGKVEELVATVSAHAQAVQAVKKAVLDIQLILLEGAKEKSQLQNASSLLTQSEYSDVVTERSISKQCGYALCQKNLIAEQTRKGRYRISLQEHKVYDLRETRLFCSSNCLVASKTFQSTLQIERDELLDKEKLMAVIRSVGELGTSKVKLNHNEKIIKDHQGSSLSDIQERQESGISSFDDAGPFDAIEGYVPQNPIRDWRSSKTAQQSGDNTRDSSQWETDSQRTPSGNEPALDARPSIEQVSLDKGKSTSTLNEADGTEFSLIPLLKSALKKEKTESLLKRSVSWKDQKQQEPKPDRKDRKMSSRLKERPKAHIRVPQTVTKMNADVLANEVTSVSTGGTITGISVSAGRTVDSNETAEAKNNYLENFVTESGTQQSQRILAAKALASALVEAAEATAGGEVGSVEAVARVGLSLVSGSESGGQLTPSVGSNEIHLDLQKTSAGSIASSAGIDVRWPELEPPEEDDLDEVTTARGAWHDAPPRNFKVEVSTFGMIWMALEEWISAATIAHIYGKDPQDQEEFVVANGREFRRQVVDQDGKSAEISRTFATSISRVFSDVVQALRLNIPMSTLEQSIGRLVTTMTFVEALPAFDLRCWRMILTLLLDGLSAQRLPSLGVHLTNNVSMFWKWLETTGTSEAEYETFRGLLLPLGRLPTYSTT